MIIPGNNSDDPGGETGFSLCRPDNLKSCAACCGLYHVADGRAESLTRILEIRTSLFATVSRDPDELDEYRRRARIAAHVGPVDPVIYVCEFAGYLDADHALIGCMLHPTFAPNRGIDYRGMCHYGSMACKAFFCPAWTLIPAEWRSILADAIPDSRLWGLAAVDVDFVHCLFALIGMHAGRPMDRSLADELGPDRLRALLGWKDSAPKDVTLRMSRYHRKQTINPAEEPYERIVRTLACSICESFHYEADADAHVAQVAKSLPRRFKELL